MSAPQYNRSIRKLVIAFGNLFNNLTLVRYNKDLTEQERVLVPISYAPKELYVRRLEFDPDLDKKVQITLPRLSFEMVGLSYDVSRKLNTNTQNFASKNASSVLAQYNPVPYNFDFNLYLYVRNIEDGTQLIERIISNFTPDYTVKVDMIPEMNQIKEVPIILNTASHDTIYEGTRDSETRVIVWTLNFTIKGYIYGERTTANVITHTITSIYNQITSDQLVTFTMDPNSGNTNYEYQIDSQVWQGYSKNMASATATVVSWDSQYNLLGLQNIQGNFVSNLPIYCTATPANYKFTTYNVSPVKYAQIDTYGNVGADNTSLTADMTVEASSNNKVVTVITES